MNSEITKGDLFQLGEHRLICGDARNQEVVAKLVDKEKIAEILTDPPYGVAVVESKTGFSQTKTQHKVIANDHIQNEKEYLIFPTEWLNATKP